MEEEFVEKFNKDSIKENVINWAFQNVSKDFVFREYQCETIVDIIYNILNNINHNQVIEAPTGSGKSLVNIISAGVLADVYEKESYILCSDLFLWKQYDDFMNNHPIIKKKFGILKGQKGNYKCAANNEDIANAECRLAGISWGNLYNNAGAFELGYSCAARCKYIKERKKALKSKVVLMTYALYLKLVVSNYGTKTPNMFKQKDTIFCDECHNAPSIVTNAFAPECKPTDIKFIETLRSYAVDVYNKINTSLFKDEEEGLDFGTITEMSQDDAKDLFFNKIYNVYINDYAAVQELEDADKQYLSLLDELNVVSDYAISKINFKKQVLHKDFDTKDKELYKACLACQSKYGEWYLLKHLISKFGRDSIIRNIDEDRVHKFKYAYFKCVKEDYLCYNFLLNTAINRVMLSATMGGIEAFEENAGISYTEEESYYKRIPSTFNFDKSPIMFLNRYKMSYANKATSFPKVKSIIYKICSGDFKDKRGMIQTGSYANAKEIYDSAPGDIQKRMLLYNDSRQKQELISIHQMSKDTILIGPTLVEGIDLPNDQCRFIIICKVPYPVITDKYVKKKIELFPLWYNSTTSNVIIQGIGRGIRNEYDYCTTYILDACFLSLYNATKDQYPEELQNRIKIYA